MRGRWRGYPKLATTQRVTHSVAALLHLCCSSVAEGYPKLATTQRVTHSVAALLHLCCSSVAEGYPNLATGSNTVKNKIEQATQQ
jgi:hypothetical protein